MGRLRPGLSRRELLVGSGACGLWAAAYGGGRVDVRGSMENDDFVAYYLDGDDKVTACLGVNRSDEVNDAKELIASHRGAPVA